VAVEALKGILSAIGNTPLIELGKLMPDARFRVFAKMERFNPAGSVKDRTALNMLIDLVRRGQLVPNRSVVVESSSGNLGVGLAQVCRYFGLRFICVVDARTTERNLAMLQAYGAEVEVVTEPDRSTGEFLAARLRRVRGLIASIPYAYWPNQYANVLNPLAHQNTMREIAEALQGRVDYLFSAVSTTGTMHGCSDYIRAHRMTTDVIAVDAVGSRIFGDTVGPRLIPGHGAGVRPALADTAHADDAVFVSDLECVVECRRLLHREAVLAGGSSGATVAALQKVADRIPDGATCVLIFPDGGDRYLDTIYSDEWVATHFGDVAHLWREAPRTAPLVAG
jgi:N-(2-amino-2-carboxyethyl)-L-glutamate synthase